MQTQEMITEEALASLIVEKLKKNAPELQAAFANSGTDIQTRHLVVDDLLPEDIAGHFYRCFPEKKLMRELSSFREHKFTFKQLDQVPPLLKNITLAIQNPEVVKAVESITGIPDQVPDPRLYAGGISLMAKGNFLNPHIDNSHDGERKLYRRLNLLYYVTPDWKPEYGGSLELWDLEVRRAVVLPSLFNRLLIMETNRFSWHSVSPVLHGGQRCCVSNYYFSPHSPENRDYFHVTSFDARPEQVFRRWVSRADNALRMGIRRLVSKGVGKTDVYKPSQKK